MTAIHAIVFYIFVLAQSATPGQGGFVMSRVLYGCPSEQKAREWAQAQIDSAHPPSPVVVKEMVVLPMSDTLITEDGQQKVDWKALPSPTARQISGPGEPLHYDAAFEDEMHDWITIPPVNGVKGDPSLDMTGDQVRDWLRKRSPEDEKRNWDARKTWYYLVFTQHQVLLIHAINSGVACIRYGKAVRGTPAGAENAQLMLWDGLSTYQEPAPAAPSPH